MRRATLRIARDGAALVLALSGCAAPPPGGRPATADAPRVAASDPGAVTAGLVEAHNQARQMAGLDRLEPDPRLAAAAGLHARDMARRHRMSHRGAGGSTPFRRIEDQGYSFRRAGENVARGQDTIASVMDDWMNSPGHRRNILGPYSQIGASCATDEDGTPYWCVTFGAPR